MDGWLDYDHDPGTGVQGFFACDGGSASEAYADYFGTTTSSTHAGVQPS